MAAASRRGRSIAHDEIELNVVPVERKRFDDLKTKSDPDFNGTRGAMSKKAIEKAGAPSDPRPCARAVGKITMISLPRRRKSALNGAISGSYGNGSKTTTTRARFQTGSSST